MNKGNLVVLLLFLMGGVALAQLSGFALDFAESKIFLPYESVPGLWITTENRL